jgi:hypothetical protein
VTRAKTIQRCFTNANVSLLVGIVVRVSLSCA